MGKPSPPEEITTLFLPVASFVPFGFAELSLTSLQTRLLTTSFFRDWIAVDFRADVLPPLLLGTVRY